MRRALIVIAILSMGGLFRCATRGSLPRSFYNDRGVSVGLNAKTAQLKLEAFGFNCSRLAPYSQKRDFFCTLDQSYVLYSCIQRAEVQVNVNDIITSITVRPEVCSGL